MQKSLYIYLFFLCSNICALADGIDRPLKLSGTLKVSGSEATSQPLAPAKANLTVFLFTNGWRYCLEFTTSTTGRRKKALEMACDGKDLYQVITSHPDVDEKPSETDRPKAPVSTSDQEVIVWPGVIPPTTVPIEIYPWLAFCSKSYFGHLPNPGKMTNIFQRASWPTNAVRFEASFGKATDLFPRDLQIYKPGFVKMKDPKNTSKSLLQSYPAPFDSGFIGAEYHVNAWTNMNGINFPKGALFAYHDLQELGQKWQLTTNITILSSLEKVEFAPDAQLVPTVKVDTQVLDLRFPAKGMISYFTTTNSPNLQAEPVVLEKIGLIGSRVTINGK